MEGSELPDFVFGVVNRRPPALKEDLEELKIIQATLQSLKWLSWCTRKLTDISSAPDSPGKKCHEYQVTFHQFHGTAATKEKILTEFTTLEEFARYLDVPLCLHNWWTALFTTLQRVFHMVLESRSSLCHPSIEACLSLTHVILTRVSYLKKNSGELVQPFLCLCCTVCRALLLQRRLDQAELLSAAVANVQKSCSQEPEDTSEERLLSCEWVSLTAACCSILKPQNSLQHLSMINNSHFHHEITYFKVCLLHDCGDYEKALDLSSTLTSERVYQRLPTPLKSHLCDVVGFCLYKTGMHYESVDWFSKAVNEDPSHIVALLHIADAYRSLKNVSAERAALRVMAQGSLNLTASCAEKMSSSSVSCEASLSESLYILGSRLFSAGFNEQAAELFENFIAKYDVTDDSEWVLLPKPTLSQIYVEAAHAHLRAKLYQKCSDLVDAVLSACPHANRELLFRKGSGACHLSRCQKNAWKSCSTSYFAFLLRAVTSMYTKRDANEEAENELRRMLSAASLLRQEDSSLQQSGHESREQSWVLQLVSQVYGNLSVLRLRRGLNVDALHSLKASLVAWPDNLDSLYNYVLLLLKLEKNRKALQVWNTAKARGLQTILNMEDSPYWEFNITLDRLKVLDAMLS